MRHAASILALAASAVAAGAFATPARANDAFDAFQQMCFTTHGDQAKALAAADQAGWQPMPPSLLAAFPPGQVDNPQGRIHSANSSFMMILVGNPSKTAFGNVAGSFCAVVTGPADADFVQAATRLANVPPDPSSQPGQNIYFWREKDGARVPVARDSDKPQSLVNDGPVSLIVTQINPQMSMVAVATLAAATATQ